MKKISSAKLCAIGCDDYARLLQAQSGDLFRN
jgi:hypothetical protein